MVALSNEVFCSSSPNRVASWFFELDALANLDTEDWADREPKAGADLEPDIEPPSLFKAAKLVSQ